MANKNELSPVMAQYLQTKENYKDCILFYRMGDFYEMFFDDAIIASKELDLILTGKQCGLSEKAPMCGIPYHASQNYISRLIAKGYKVAICEQMATPQKGVKFLPREVVRVVTPGTIVEDEMLEGGKNNYLMTVFKSFDKAGVCYVDISTGEFAVLPIEKDVERTLSDVIARVNPSEIICNENASDLLSRIKQTRGNVIGKFYPYYEWAFSKSRADENLTAQFGGNYQVVYELKNKPELIASSGATLEYLKETQKRLLKSITKINMIRNEMFLTIDSNSRRNLEIVENMRDRSKTGSLLWVLDKTKTSMGGRKLRSMLDQPLQDEKEINARLDAVDELYKNLIMRDSLSEALSSINDIERIAGRIGYGTVSPKELLGLKTTLFALPPLKKTLESAKSEKLQNCYSNLLDMSELATLLDQAINPDAPSLTKDGNYIKAGFNKELDKLREAKTSAKNWIADLEAKEIEETGIKNLKIGYNRVFGYYIEVSKNQAENVPLRYKRRQTIANNERYITEDLKQIEDLVLNSEENALKLESQIFAELKNYLNSQIVSLQQVAKAVAEIDALLSLAEVAVKNNYCKPKISKKITHLKIEAGRHPVVEQYLKNGQFVANDTYLDQNENRMMVITGPNMAGKSTYMRQSAIITYMAHIGSFVPARVAEISLTDRIFTRVGASDDLAFGQSTFMVEMSEVALILANATDRSLIILDEIGRGTSTFDGLSIAWAVIEYLAKNFKAKTLFATHYHELTELEGVIDGIKNYRIAVKEIDDNIVFLRKIVRGGANRSFGIEVARLAGLPQEVLTRAKEISKNLESVNTSLDLNLFEENKQKAANNTKTALSILSALKDVDMNKVSPMYAFELLNDFVTKAKEEDDE